MTRKRKVRLEQEIKEQTNEREDGYVYVHSTIKVPSKGEADVTEEQTRLKVPTFGYTIPARVSVEGSITKNMGNYESAKVTVRVERPCLNNEEEIETAYNVISDTVDKYINRELELLGLDLKEEADE